MRGALPVILLFVVALTPSLTVGLLPLAFRVQNDGNHVGVGRTSNRRGSVGAQTSGFVGVADAGGAARRVFDPPERGERAAGGGRGRGGLRQPRAAGGRRGRG